LAELWGMYIGDGSNHRDGIRFSVGEESRELVDYISKISLELFNKKPSVSRYEKKSCYEVALLSVELKEWFASLGITKASARSARIPKILKNAGEDYICGFLRGLFSTDGCIRKSGHIALSTTSSALAEELQVIMLYLGIPTQKTYRPDTDSYQVSVCNKSGFAIFRDKIGFLIRAKQERLSSVNIEEIFTKGQIIPNQKNRLSSWYNSLEDILERRRAADFIEGIIHRPSGFRQLTRQKALLMQEDGLGPEFLKQFLQDNLFYTKISSIKHCGKSVVYDLTVPYKHSYVANGFVSHNSGGGTGFSFSRLRSKNAVVKTTGGVASGPISFMRVYDAATEAVKQGGTRRGANMGILRVDHPDVLEFITCKDNNKQINNFNISIALTDEFMRKLEKNEDYDLIDPHTQKVVEKVNSKEVFDLIVKQAHKNGEPGVIFIDRMNEFNPTPKLGKYESTNPCGEQVLLPYESCDLGSINLSLICKQRDGLYEIDWNRLKEVTHLAVYFLDNLIDENKFPLLQIEKATKATRKVGLGVMGWASLLIRLNIPYNSDEAVALAEKVMSFILDEAVKKSLELGKAKGAFPAFKGSIYDKKNATAKMRNATLTTIAPTGTISIIAGPCSSGIEPLFAISYYRNVMDNDKLVEVDPLFEEVARLRGFYSRELMEKIAKSGSLAHIEEVPEDVKKIFVTAHDISPEWHVRMQAAFQRFVHNATSKTINFPEEASIEDVREAYLLAYDLGCKGITVYRDKSREEQVLNIGSSKEDKSIKTDTFKQDFKKEIAPRPRPEVIFGTTTKVPTGCGNLYVTINVDEKGEPFELFTQMGKAGGCAASQLEAIGRLVSLGFRTGVEVKSIIEQLRNIRCPSPSWEKGQRIFSCADAIARVIERRLVNTQTSKEGLEVAPIAMKHSSDDEQVVTEINNSTSRGDIVGVCPDCGGALRHEEGCMKCYACGFSKC
jgi:ribonucleoside-diphosphate reductase alpha chain